MTDIDHYLAERATDMTDEYLSSAGHWERINVSASAIIGDPQKLNLPVIVQDLCRALLDLHEALTASPCDCARHDAYAAREAEQREAAEPDPLDESDHRDRFDCDGDRIVRHGERHWHYWDTPCACHPGSLLKSLRDFTLFGPLTFAPDEPQEAASSHETPPSTPAGPEDGPDEDDGPLECPDCGHQMSAHKYDDDYADDRCWDCDIDRNTGERSDVCRLLPSDIARVLIDRAVTTERHRLAQEVRYLGSRLDNEWALTGVTPDHRGRANALADEWEAL